MTIGPGLLFEWGFYSKGCCERLSDYWLLLLLVNYMCGLVTEEEDGFYNGLFYVNIGFYIVT